MVTFSLLLEGMASRAACTVLYLPEPSAATTSFFCAAATCIINNHIAPSTICFMLLDFGYYDAGSKFRFQCLQVLQHQLCYQPGAEFIEMGIIIPAIGIVGMLTGVE